tara:strand:+ start:1109 stop:1261 length:153 start_codon:yes stop_codon:yes gene_type:complete
VSELEMLDYIKRCLLNDSASDAERQQAVLLVDDLTVPYLLDFKRSLEEWS